MGKLITIIVLIVIVAYILSLFGGSSPQPSSPPPANVSQEETADAPAPPSEPSASPTPSLAPQYVAKLEAAAREDNVRIQILKITGNQAHVRVTWTGSSAATGGEFINSLLFKNIIRNFDNVGDNKYGRDSQGRQQWAQEFMLSMV